MSKKFGLLLLLLGSLTLSGCDFSDDSSSDIPSPISSSSELTTRQIIEAAIEEISNYLDKSLYRENEVKTIDELIEYYSNLIRASRDRDQIAAYVRECKAQLDLIKTDAELKEEEEKADGLKVFNLLNKQEHYDILFIGSSYVYYYDQFRLLENILEGEGYDVTIDELVRGSATLQMFNDPYDDLYSALDTKLSQNQYEYIFLEELSTRPLKKFDLFDEAVGKLLERIFNSQNNCETLLFEVWARDEECSWYDENPTYTYESMQEELVTAYQKVADKYGLRVSYAGQSFYNVYKNKNKAVDLYSADKSHPSLAGAYLSALTHFNTLTGIDASKVNYYPDNFEVVHHGDTRGLHSMNMEDAKILKNSVLNHYGEEREAKLRVYVWASNNNDIFYSDKEIARIKKALPKAIKKNLAVSFDLIKRVSVDEFKNEMSLAKDVDVVLAGGNMDTTIGLVLETAEDLKKAKIGLNWFAAENRYIGIIKGAKNLEEAKAMRLMLIQDGEAQKTINVLFIGNSYTFYNDMYLMFNELCESLSLDVLAQKVTLGSRKLIDYQNLDDTTNELKEKLNNVSFNYIFLQEQSNYPITNYNNFVNGISAVSRLIRNSDLNKNAEILLYNTWAREEGNSYYDTHYTNLSTPESKYLAMTKDLAKAYRNAGEEFGYRVSYAGIGMYEAHTKHPEMKMYHTDKTHPSPLASYMVALIHAATLFNIDPREVTYIPSFTEFYGGDCQPIMPTTQEAIILRNIAYNVSNNLDKSFFN